MEEQVITRNVTLKQVLMNEYMFEFDDFVEQLLNRYDCSIVNTGNLAVSIYRIQRQLFLKGNYQELLDVLSIIQNQNCCCTLYYSAEIGENFNLVHSFGTVIGSKVKIGNDCNFYQNVTIGAKDEYSNVRPTIGNNVTIYAGAVVIGDIMIEDNVVIGANSVVTRSIKSGEIWAGIPARLIWRKETSDE